MWFRQARVEVCVCGVCGGIDRDWAHTRREGVVRVLVWAIHRGLKRGGGACLPFPSFRLLLGDRERGRERAGGRLWGYEGAVFVSPVWVCMFVFWGLSCGEHTRKSGVVDSTHGVGSRGRGEKWEWEWGRC